MLVSASSGQHRTFTQTVYTTDQQLLTRLSAPQPTCRRPKSESKLIQLYSETRGSVIFLSQRGDLCCAAEHGVQRKLVSKVSRCIDVFLECVDGVLSER
jgi:hypothetical protein